MPKIPCQRVPCQYDYFKKLIPFILELPILRWHVTGVHFIKGFRSQPSTPTAIHMADNHNPQNTYKYAYIDIYEYKCIYIYMHGNAGMN